MKPHGRIFRILTGFLIPPILGVVLLYVFLLLLSGSTSDTSFAYGVLLLGIPLSFLVVGVQALIFTLVMEYVINPNIQNNWQAIGMAVLLGAISGVFLSWLLCVLGMVVGLLLGWYLRYHFNKSVNKLMLSQP